MFKFSTFLEKVNWPIIDLKLHIQNKRERAYKRSKISISIVHADILTHIVFVNFPGCWISSKEINSKAKGLKNCFKYIVRQPKTFFKNGGFFVNPKNLNVCYTFAVPDLRTIFYSMIVSTKRISRPTLLC